MPEAGIHVLVAPSWGPDTILPRCGLGLIGVLLDAGFRVTLRPHFQTRWTMPEVIDRVADRYRDHPRFALVEEMAERESLFDAHAHGDGLVGRRLDFALGLEKPVLFIDVPPKTRNDSWQELGIEPFESSVRNKIGAILPPGPRSPRRPTCAPARPRTSSDFRRRASLLRAGAYSTSVDSGAAGADGDRPRGARGLPPAPRPGDVRTTDDEPATGRREAP